MLRKQPRSQASDPTTTSTKPFPRPVLVTLISSRPSIRYLVCRKHPPRKSPQALWHLLFWPSGRAATPRGSSQLGPRTAPKPTPLPPPRHDLPTAVPPRQVALLSQRSQTRRRAPQHHRPQSTFPSARKNLEVLLSNHHQTNHHTCFSRRYEHGNASQSWLRVWTSLLSGLSGRSHFTATVSQAAPQPLPPWCRIIACIFYMSHRLRRVFSLGPIAASDKMPMVLVACPAQNTTSSSFPDLSRASQQA